MGRKFFASLFLVLGMTLLTLEAVELVVGKLSITERLFPALFDLAVALLLLWGYRRTHVHRRIGFGVGAMLTVVLFFGLLVTAFSALVVYVDSALDGRTYAGVYDDCYKVWAARGLVEGGTDITHAGEQNSITSISRAFAAGAKGVEVDVHFDAGQGIYIVSHDFPYNLKDGALLTLEALLEALPGDRYFWLDFKKLRHLDDKALAAAVDELGRLERKFGLQGHFYVEGAAPFSLAAFQRAGFRTLFDIHPLNDDHALTPMVINLYKLVFYFGDFSVMGMNYFFRDSANPIYADRTRRLLAGIPVFIYHVPDDRAVLSDLSADPSVRVILVVHHNLNRYATTACASR
jgi:glycerophosphoryl diester phosphodiesterase